MEIPESSDVVSGVEKPGTPGFYDPAAYTAESSVGLLMRRVVMSIKWQVDRRLSEHGLTDAQWVPLYKLVHHPACSTVAGLAREIEMDPGATTRALDRLEAKGLIQRERSSVDRRVVNLVLTDEGRRVAQIVPAVLAQVLNEHLRGFSEEEFTLLNGLLGRMLANGCALRAGTAAVEGQEGA